MNTQELARRAAQEGLLDVAYSTVDAPFGRMLVAATPRGLVRTAFDIPIDWRLSSGFLLRAREECARIPYGEVRTYSELAAAAGSPHAVRAAGNAMAKNPIPIVVPCHRVLRTGGSLGGYGGGLECKRWLLDLESGTLRL